MFYVSLEKKNNLNTLKAKILNTELNNVTTATSALALHQKFCSNCSSQKILQFVGNKWSPITYTFMKADYDSQAKGSTPTSILQNTAMSASFCFSDNRNATISPYYLIHTMFSILLKIKVVHSKVRMKNQWKEFLWNFKTKISRYFSTYKN